MTTKRPSLKERVFEKLQGTRSRSSSEDLSKTGSDSDSGGNRHSHTIWYAHPQDSSENSSSQQARYKTDNLQSEKGSPELSVELDCSHSSENNKLDKSKRKSQPPGTTDYIVKEWDTLESIAAFYDLTPSELIKLNRLSTRYIYPGQNLFVPSPEYGEETQDPVLDSHDENPPIEKPKMDIPIVRMADKPPAKVPGHVERIASPLSSPKHEPTDIPQKLSEEEASQLDQECHERFIKVNVKHITDGQGVVSGVLLVTPNAVMFDPNVSDPLVLEHGAEQYGVIAPMDMVVSAAMYHDIAAMKVRGQSRNHDDNTPRPEVYHDTACPLYKTWCEGHHKGQNNPAPSHPQTTVHDKHLSREDSVCSCGPSQVSPKLQRYHVTDSRTLSSDSADNSKLSHIMSEIITDTAKTNEVVDDSSSSHDFGDFVSAEPVCRDVVDSHSKWTDILSCQEKSSEISVPPTSVSSEEDKTSQEIEKSSEELRIGNIVYLPYQKNDQGEISVEDVENAKETLQKMSIDEDFLQKDRSVSTPIDIHSSDSLKQASASPEQKTGSFGSFNVTPHLNAFVNYATGLFKLSDIKDIAEARQNEPEISKPSEKSSGVSQLVHKKIASLTHISDTKDLEVAVENAVKLSDKPELFQSFDKLIPRPATTFEDPPLYLCLRLGKPINKNISQTCPIQAYSKRKKKPEYWFSIPRDKVDQLYAFFVQWKPEIYGDEEDVSAENRGFVVLDDEAMPGDMEIHEDYFNSTLQKDWEIISSEEALRRKSVDIDESLLLPELIGESTILQDFHIQMINKHMPARTIGYPWTLNYSTDQHGFSLKTLYRDMYKQDSPVLLIVKDTRDNIFGALTSCELKQSDHFYGTGESFLFTFWPEFKVFRWTGDNSLFIKGSPESLAIGAGQGMFGLWLDGDLYHGRTNRCETYDNDVLTESEDFVVKAFEAWIFNQD